LNDIAIRLNLYNNETDLKDKDEVIGMLETKFQSLFQENSLKIFQLTDQ
jgi:hypothetical protein